MANMCHVVFAKIKGRSFSDSQVIQVMHREAVASETLTIGRNPTTTTIRVGSSGDVLKNFIADITVDTSCWVAAGPNPDPRVNPRWLLLEGTSLTLTLETGDRVACVRL